MTKIRRGRGQRGAAVVEFAIVGPVLFLLIFGLIDFGLVFNDYLAVRNGVQNGARLGAVANFGANPTGACTLTGVTPSPTSMEAKELMCLVKDRMGLNDANARVNIVVDPVAGYADGSELVVCAQYPASSRTKLLAPVLNGRIMTTRVSARIEQTSWEIASPALLGPPVSVGTTGDLRSAQESPLPGSSWNCNL
jgi:Flp pilus assembly protein TadG